MIKSKNDLVNSINSELSDNSSGDISPKDIRHNLIDIIDSVHNLLTDKIVNTAHFGTPEESSVRLGKKSLDKLDLAGYSTSGNTAIGFGALENNYDKAVRNTALGAYALNCNLHGRDNVGIGYSSLAGNTTGYGNISLGSFALNDIKTGDFNIAIGHGAGYYVDKDSQNKLYIGSHPVDSTYICANPDGAGLVPLMFGDMSSNNLRLGIKTRALNDYGVLQVSGNITPSFTDKFTLGHSLYRWDGVLSRYTNTDELQLTNSNSLHGHSSGIFVSGSLIPNNNNIYNIGSSTNIWKNAYFDNIDTRELTAVQQVHYLHKSLYLASSGTFDTIDGGGPESIYDHFTGVNEEKILLPYLSESGVRDAGLIIKVSGHPDFTWVFDTDHDVCGKQFRRWKTNIGIEVGSGQYIRSPALLSPETSCHGIHLSGSQVVVTTNDVFSNVGTIAGTGDINFIADSGAGLTEYSVNYISQISGVDISQKFLSRSAEKQQDSSGKDLLTGFVLRYSDSFGEALHSDHNLDRFIISSFANSSKAKNNIILMKESENSGVFGINNFTEGDGQLGVPNTIFNVRSKDDAVARISSESTGNVKSSLELAVGQNCLEDAAEFTISNTRKSLDINLYKSSGQIPFATFDTTTSYPTVGILTSGTPNETLTIGSSGYVNAGISMFSRPSNPIPASGHGKVFVKDYSKVGDTQSHSLYFMDGSGNVYNLVEGNSCTSDTNKTFSSRENIAIGPFSMQERCSDTFVQNVGIGHYALSLVSGINGSYNTAVGHGSAQNITTGKYNVSVGHDTLTTASGYVSYNIVLGHGIGDKISDDYNLLIGSSGKLPLMSGHLNSGVLRFPNGNLYVDDSTSTNSLLLQNNALQLVDIAGQEFVDDSLSFNFQTPSGNNNLLSLNHNASGMTETATYSGPTNPRPFAELKGDFKLKGAIRFRDGTSLESATKIQNLPDELFVEGFADSNISVAASYSSAVTGTITNTSTSKSYTVYNRDRHSKIKQGDYVIALYINGEYRPIWVSNESSVCNCCTK